MNPAHPRSERGSLLIVAMIFAAVVSLLLASYIRLSTTALNLSQRAFCENSAMNLTESGLELAMAAINSNTWSSPWTITGADASGTFTDFQIGQNMTGTVQVYVQNYGGSSPLVVAKGIVTPNQGPSITKMVEISGIMQRSLFAKGLVGRNGVSFSGNNASVDSWDSNPTGSAAGSYTPVAYSGAVKHDHGSIAAVNITATDAVGNANIWGSASVGGASTALISVGSQGSVGPFGTASGTKNADSISANFTANLPNISTPTPPSSPYVIGAISGTTTLPRAGDTAAADGKYYYSVSSVNLSGNASTKLSIAANNNVVMLLTAGSGSSAVSLGGQASIAIASGANLSMYGEGDFDFSGGGVANSNASSSTTSFQIWGTNTHAGSQHITVSGNGSLSGTVYAPNAVLSAKGGGNSGAIYGAFVAYSVTITGNDAFHYDENLGRQGNAGNFNPTKWRELVTASDRNTYAAHF